MPKATISFRRRLQFSLGPGHDHFLRTAEFGTKITFACCCCCCRTVFYGQYKCTGPGASYAGRVAWSHELTDDEAKPFISLSFIDGTEWVRL